VANLLIDEGSVTVTLTTAEKFEALHGDVIIPRASVRDVRVVEDGMEEIHGVKMPGTGFPGVVMVGTWRDTSGVTFAVCHGRRPAVVLELNGHPFDRVVVTVDNPEEALDAFP
jgi:hypothetical protein